MFLSLTGSFTRSWLGVAPQALASLGPAPACSAPVSSSPDSSSAPAPSTSSSPPVDGAVVPKEWRRLLEALSQDACLRTRSLFAHSLQHVLQPGPDGAAATAPSTSTPAAAPGGLSPELLQQHRLLQGSAASSSSRSLQERLLAVLAPLHDALNQDLPLPSGADSAHALAALLLLALGKLPGPLLPAAAADMCNVPRERLVLGAALARVDVLVQAQQPPAQAGTCRAVLELMRRVAAAEVEGDGGEGAACVLAQVEWGGGGSSLTCCHML